ncbi:DUF3137 domain-containing protein [Aurantiacibacter zhengii]|uniref:DUF3137 domain-containing protein n=1 Tax=Aurantiacibacter zhengii TaxID=2307003 RepID=A0A418NPR8_9SPHN|nr:DUF3137 domain-containing protein [Aurantiacibacter zhengii]RIV84531.1 DUF3137 domain-containing protein [Aurantiacibacter zhengii]
MIERPDVNDLMAGGLGQFLHGQIAVREDAKASTRNRYFICAVVALPILGFVWFAPLGDVRFFITAVITMGALWWSRIPINKAKKQTKSGINAAIAQALGLDYQHDCDAGHGFARARAHKMLPSFDRSNFEDLWQGEMAGKPFTLHEAHLEERRGSGKNRHWVTVFRGPVITIGFSRQFHATTLVERAGRHTKLLFFGEKDRLKVDGQVLDKADMVHPDFEDAFTVFTSDQTEARYLVHPTYIERLIALENAFRGKDIKTLFKDGELTIVLKSENMFESGSLDHNRDREMVETCVSQFMAMADLCAQLNEVER